MQQIEYTFIVLNLLSMSTGTKKTSKVEIASKISAITNQTTKRDYLIWVHYI
jgi:hypothetical protein